MNRRQWMMVSGAAVAVRSGYAQAQPPAGPAEAKQDTPDKFLLMDYRPESIYKVPKTEVMKAKYPVIDVHCHGPEGSQQVDDMVKLMDAVGVEKTVIFTGESTPERFGQARERYVKYPTRFDLWCSFDLTGVNEPGFGPNALKALVTVTAWARWAWARSATKAMECGVAARGGEARRVRRTGRRAVTQAGAVVSFRLPPLPPGRTPTIRAWMLSGINARSWECPSISTSRTRSGPISRWTGRITA